MALFAIVYFIFILDYRNGVRQKADMSDFFKIQFKMGHKAAETTRNINNTFGPWTANEHAVQQWFKKFCKGNGSLEDKKYNDQSLWVDNDHLRAITEADPLTNTREVAEKLDVDHSMVV